LFLNATAPLLSYDAVFEHLHRDIHRGDRVGQTTIPPFPLDTRSEGKLFGAFDAGLFVDIVSKIKSKINK